MRSFACFSSKFGFNASILKHSTLSNFKFKYISTSSSSNDVNVEVRDHVQWIRLNRPEKYNAISVDTYESIILALEEAAANKQVKMVAVTGTGKFFSSGNDLNNNKTWLELADGDTVKAAQLSIANVERFVSEFIDFPKPLLGIVNGPALGIMVTTLGLYDWVIASDTATFTAPFTKLGICPEGCSSYTFPIIFGPSLASELLLFNQTITAVQAAQAGFVSRVVPKAELENQVEPLLHEKHDGLVENARFSNSIALAKGLIRDEKTRQMLHKVNKRECETLMKTFMGEERGKAIEKFFTRKSQIQ